MAFGEGLMLQDGSAVDGPHTGYLNAVDRMMRDCEMESERNLRGFGPAPEVVHPSYQKDSLTRTIPGPGPMLFIAECWNANVKSKSKIVKELLCGPGERFPEAGQTRSSSRYQIYPRYSW